jgi:hypothetical protein
MLLHTSIPPEATIILLPKRQDCEFLIYEDWARRDCSLSLALRKYGTPDPRQRQQAGVFLQIAAKLVRILLWNHLCLLALSRSARTNASLKVASFFSLKIRS